METVYIATIVAHHPLVPYCLGIHGIWLGSYSDKHTCVYTAVDMMARYEKWQKLHIKSNFELNFLKNESMDFSEIEHGMSSGSGLWHIQNPWKNYIKPLHSI